MGEVGRRVSVEMGPELGVNHARKAQKYLK